MIRASRLLALVVLTGWLGAGLLRPAWGQQSPGLKPLVRMPFPRDEGTLTPYTFDTAYQLLTYVYDTLMWRDVDGVPQPWLARSVEVSSDGMQVTVRLAEGARWHDGKPVTASDVAFSYMLFSRRPHPRFGPQLRPIRSLSAPARDTVVINLRWPSPGFLDQPMSDVPIVPRHLWESLPPGRSTPEGPPIGSGPYRLVEHRSGEIYRFDADPAYFRGPPSVAKIEVPIIGTTEERVRAFERGELDVVSVAFPERLPDRVRRAGVRIVEGPSFAGTVLMFNLRRAPFDRIETRHAVARSIDLRRMRRVIGQAVAGDRGQLHPDSSWGAQTDLHVFDERAARETLATLDQPLKILAPANDLSHLEAADQVALALERAGATAEMKRVLENELSKSVGEEGSEPSFQVAIWNTPALASYDPSLLIALFGSDPRIGTLNFSGYSSQAFDRLAASIVSTTDAAQRRAAVDEAVRTLSIDLPLVPLFFLTGVFAYRPAVHDGWLFVKGSGILDKRSFTDRKSQTPAPPDGEIFPQPEGRRGLSILGGLALVTFGVAAALAIALLRRSRRRDSGGQTPREIP